MLSVHDPECDEMLGYVDRSITCDEKISHSLEGSLFIVLVSS